MNELPIQDLLFSYGPVGPPGMNQVCKGPGVLEYCTGSFCDPVQSHSITQFGLWAVMGAPLLLSFDIGSLTNSRTLLEVYANPEIIAVSQDVDEQGRGSLGGRRVLGGDFPESEPVQSTDDVRVSTTTNRNIQSCDASTFTRNMSGVEVEGLACHNASSPAECIAACCDMPDCTTWQWSLQHSKGGTPFCSMSKNGGVFGACWIGTSRKISSNAPSWIGASTAPTPSPPPSGSSVNIWARNLHSGETAMIFVNTGDISAVIKCDLGCVQASSLNVGST